jgi:hypothetical protein
MESAQLVIWPCLDNLVSCDGNRSLVGLAEGWADRCSNAAIPAATVAQCRVVRTILSAKITGLGLYRDCRFVVCHPGDNDRILESSSGRRLVALAIFNLGWLRNSTQLFNLAVERLTMFATTIGIPN